MRSERTEAVFDEVVAAVERLRNILTGNAVKAESALDAFWSLQDHLHRLVAYVDDTPQILGDLPDRYRNLAANVIATIRRAESLHLLANAGVNRACDAINRSLCEMQRVKDGRRAMAAPSSW